MPVTFGRALRPLWGLAADVVFLNHGSFGACPLEVRAAQDAIRARMETQPDLFFTNEIVPRQTASTLRAAAAAAARFVNVAPDSIAFVENATSGIQAVLRSLAFAPGDEILLTDHTYNAVRLMVDARCAESGATARVVPLALPATPDDVAARIEAGLSPRVKLAIIDHITSPSALVLPLARLIPALRQSGARVLVDGAHGIGQVPLDLAALAPDWYVSNLHKWLFAPKGCAVLFASPEAAPLTQPHVVSHFIGLGFPRAFDYIGTRDYTAWLAAPAALAFFEKLGPELLRAHQARLIDVCTEMFAALAITPIASRAMCAAMRTFVLPQRRAATPEDADTLLRALWDQERIQARPLVLGDKLMMRVSAQAYVDEDDIRRLADALGRLGWPARAK